MGQRSNPKLYVSSYRVKKETEMNQPNKGSNPMNTGWVAHDTHTHTERERERERDRE